jgi:hypothetical protein
MKGQFSCTSLEEAVSSQKLQGLLGPGSRQSLLGDTVRPAGLA